MVALKQSFHKTKINNIFFTVKFSTEYFYHAFTNFDTINTPLWLMWNCLMSKGCIWLIYLICMWEFWRVDVNIPRNSSPFSLMALEQCRAYFPTTIKEFVCCKKTFEVNGWWLEIYNLNWGSQCLIGSNENIYEHIFSLVKTVMSIHNRYFVTHT